MSLPTPESTAARGGPAWLVAARQDAANWLATSPAPSSSAEVWRYSPIDDLDLGVFLPGATGTQARTLGGLEGIGVRIDAAALLAGASDVDGVSVSSLSAHPEGEALLGRHIFRCVHLVREFTVLLLFVLVVAALRLFIK